MDDAFLFRLIISFAVGGFYIVLIARLAELFGSAVAGALASTPTTIFVGNVFLGLAEGKRVLFESVPGTLFGMTCTLVLLMVFVTVNRGRKFEVAIAAGLLVWLLGIVFLGSVGGSSTFVASVVYLSTCLVTYYYFKGIEVKAAKANPIDGKVLLLRAALAGSVVVAVLVVARFAGGFWGGVAGAFPAMFLSGIYTLEKSQGKEFTHSFIKVLPVGSLSTFSYVTLVGFLSLKVGLLLTIVIAFSTSLIVARIIYVSRQGGISHLPKVQNI